MTTSQQKRAAELERMLGSLKMIYCCAFSIGKFGRGCTMFAPGDQSVRRRRRRGTFNGLARRRTSRLCSLLRANRSVTAQVHRFVGGRRLPFVTASQDMLGLPTVNGDVAFGLIKVARRNEHVLHFSRSDAHHRDSVVSGLKGVCVMRGGSLTTCLERLDGVKRSPRSCTDV